MVSTVAYGFQDFSLSIASTKAACGGRAVGGRTADASSDAFGVALQLGLSLSPVLGTGRPFSLERGLVDTGLGGCVWSLTLDRVGGPRGGCTVFKAISLATFSRSLLRGLGVRRELRCLIYGFIIYFDSSCLVGTTLGLALKESRRSRPSLDVTAFMASYQGRSGGTALEALDEPFRAFLPTLLGVSCRGSSSNFGVVTYSPSVREQGGAFTGRLMVSLTAISILGCRQLRSPLCLGPAHRPL